VIKEFKGRLYKDIDLAPYTSFKIGGKADFLIIPNSWEELISILDNLSIKKIPVKILGQGSNILIPDEGIEGAVIRLNKNLGKTKLIDSFLIEVEAGCLISSLLSFLMENNLGGIEFMIGIPGTLGGAVQGNAGAWGMSIGDYVKRVTVIDENLKEKDIDKKDLEFSYRHSNITSNLIIKSVIIKVKKQPKDIALSLIKSYLKERAKRLPRLPSAGSIFRNPKEGSAGYFIESLGFKGKKVGDAMVSYEHANIIVNLGKAKAKDVKELIDLIREKVKEAYGIDLELEIVLW